MNTPSRTRYRKGLPRNALGDDSDRSRCNEQDTGRFGQVGSYSHPEVRAGSDPHPHYPDALRTPLYMALGLTIAGSIAEVHALTSWRSRARWIGPLPSLKSQASTLLSPSTRTPICPNGWTTQSLALCVLRSHHFTASAGHPRGVRPVPEECQVPLSSRTDGLATTRQHPPAPSGVPARHAGRMGQEIR